MIYREYINSSAWRHSSARLEELAASGFRCRLCNRSNAEIELQVHHRTYERLGAEEAGDLTTLCNECHLVVTDMLRCRRYSAYTPLFSDVVTSIANPTPLKDPTR
jgi:5-methylcytosine-specific restriction endonuclease McrA